MFNVITADMIKALPPIDGVDAERLPQLLSKVYAHILGLKTKYGQGEIPFVAEELDKDYRMLRKLAFALELYLESEKYEDYLRPIAYVAAMAHKMLGKMEQMPTQSLTIDSVPSDVSAALLFVIGGYFADAEEMAQAIKPRDEDSLAKKQLIQFVCLLTKGHLNEIIEAKGVEPQRDTLETLAEDLMWGHLSMGLRVLAASLLGRTHDDYRPFFYKVQELSIYVDEETEFRYAYTGTFRLSRLLIRAAEMLMNHSVVNNVARYLTSTEHLDVLYNIANARPYLWDNHLDAINNGFLEFGTSSVITFPTGAGKSTLVELKVMQAVKNGGKVVYIVPTHALESQAKDNMARLFGLDSYEDLQIGREFTFMEEDDDMPVMVMTPERCSTLLTLHPDIFEGVSLVMMDEFHIISSGDHRSLGAMFCLISLLSLVPEADYVLVSAMVENGNEISGWISEVTGRRCLNLSMPWKPTSQLQGCVVYQEKEVKELLQLCKTDKKARREQGKKSPSTDLKNHLMAKPYCLFSLCNTWESQRIDDYYLSPLVDYPISLGVGKYWNLIGNRNEVARLLAQKFASIGMKTIVFVENPAQANSMVKKVDSEISLKRLPASLRPKFNSIVTELGEVSSSYIQQQMGAVQHHGQLLPEERYIMEQMFKKSVDIMVATPTLAQGVNLPVDIVLLAGEDRYNPEEQGRSRMEAHEILNAAGRAGRAGFRSQGAAILVSNDVIGIDGNKLKDTWFKLKEEIFSKGDQCLKVIDPFEELSSRDDEPITTEQKLVLMKMNLQGEGKQSLLKKSFYAYQLRHSQKQESDFVERIEKLANSYEGEKNNGLIELSFKSGVESEILESFYQWIGGHELQKHNMTSILDYYCDWLKDYPKALGNLLVYESTMAELKGLLNNAEEEGLDADGIENLNYLLQLYLHGSTYMEIYEELNVKRPDAYMTAARKFVLKIIPELSYAFSVLTMVLIQFIQDHEGADADIPENIKNFATYFKEGVTSEGMLRYKTKGKLMRVECHNNYAK